jgi:two-component system sensor histidine kinase KdpD
VSPTRVLACISEGETAGEVNRAAVRLARELRAELLALHVQPSGAATRREPAVSARLERNLRHAADLGAQVEVLTSHRVAETILRFARSHDVSHILVGERRRGGWRGALSEDVPARLRAAFDHVLIVANGASGEGLAPR